MGTESKHCFSTACVFENSKVAVARNVARAQTLKARAIVAGWKQTGER